MALNKHLKILKRGSKVWNTWRQERPRVVPELSGADLTDAQLSGANLRRARLSGVSFANANLAGADLSRTTLRHANLTGANLMGANLAHAGLLGTVLAALDLSACLGLAEVRHLGPSGLSTSTLERTAEGLSQKPARRGDVETFLRGTGVPESLIANWFAFLIANPIEFYSSFISYSHRDQTFARRLYNDLQGQGIRCWLDEHQLLPGDDIYDAVDRGIRLWDKILLCCSEASLTSWWVEDEISKALAKERGFRREQGKKVLAIVPLNLDGYLFKGWKSGRATAISDRLAADFTGWENDNAKFQEQFDRVVKALQTGEGGREAPPESKL